MVEHSLAILTIGASRDATGAVQARALSGPEWQALAKQLALLLANSRLHYKAFRALSDTCPRGERILLIVTLE